MSPRNDGGSSATTPPVEAAADAAVAEPESTAAWERLEQAAADADEPEAAMRAYAAAVAGDLGPDAIVAVARRAVDFHDQWFGDATPELRRVLERVLAVAPSADWALRRLSVALTAAEAWSDLLAHYDRALATDLPKSRRAALLEEAANVAKDFAADYDRAITYLTELRRLRPRNKPVALALERLLDRQERWRDLIDLWTERLDLLSGDEALRTRERIAACWLERLGRPDEALAAIEALLPEADDDTEACRLLEAIATGEAATDDVREAALRLLRGRYEAAGRERDFVAVLEAALERFAPARRAGLRAELGRLLADIGEGAASLDHYAALLEHAPDDASAEEELRHLARQTGALDRYANALVTAASAAAPARSLHLLREAARVRRDDLGDRDGAIAALRAAYSLDAEPGDVAAACRELDELLAAAGRNADRLPVLERLAQVERRDAERRRVLAELARVADGIGERDLAVTMWQRRLADDPADREAMDALVALHEDRGSWRLLVDALRRRAEGPQPDHGKRADLVRAAEVLAERLDDPDGAIALYEEVHARFGESPATVEALAALLRRQQKWDALAALLDRASARELARATDWLGRLGDVCLHNLDDPIRAAAAYARAVDVDPHDVRAREGLRALAGSDGDARRLALDALSRAAARTGQWEQALELVDARVAAAATDAERVAIWREAAELYERRANDLAAAQAALAAALRAAPADRSLAAELERVADARGATDELAAALAAAVEAAPDAEVAARLREAEGRAHERRGDPAAAQAAYAAAAAARQPDVDLLDALARAAAAAGDWTAAAGAVVDAIAREGFGDGDRVARLAAAAGDALAAAASALADAIGARSDLEARDASRVELVLASWFRDRLGDRDAAIAALRRALARVPGQVPALVQLVELLRAEPGAALYDALRELAEVVVDDLDALSDAAAVARDVLGDPARERVVLEALMARAVRAWRTTDDPSRAATAAAASIDAATRLVDLALAAGDAERALALLDEAAQWPVDAERRRAFRLRAAAIAEEVGAPRRAAALYRAALQDAPDDDAVLDRLASLYEQLDEVGELLSVRRAQLGRAAEPERRVALRLDLCRLAGELERRAARLDALRDNLRELPGHRESIDALCDLLAERGRLAEMVDLLADQAAQIEAAGGDVAYAAALLLRAARVCERDLGDADRAIALYRDAVRLAPTAAEALDGLARLHVARGEHAQAVPWLEQWLDRAGGERGPVTLRLARALLAAGDREGAIARLEAAGDARVADPALRELLASLYRDAGAHEPLARLLTDSLDALADADAKLAAAREATSLYRDVLGEPALAVTALRKALAVSPGDPVLRTQLAEGLRLAGRLDEARAELAALLEEFGRRRSPERAAVHHQLALVARDAGDIDAAIAELQAAAKMDRDNADVLVALAELAREHGRVSEAERAYRSLLLVARRSARDDVDAIGPSEVLIALHHLARESGDEERAAELRESAVETAIESDVEVRRARRALVRQGDYDTLLEILQERLGLVTDDAARAQTLAYLAEALDKLGRGAEGLDALLRALEHAPGREDLHDAARAAARAEGATGRYVDVVRELAGRARRREDAERAAVLWWKLGEAYEHDVGDLDAAVDAYERMERTGARRADALSALARVHGARGDAQAQAQALSELLRMVDAAPPEARADALYQLAELRLVDPTTHADGLAHLEEALRVDARFDRAAAMLRAALDAVPESAAALDLYAKVARRSGDRERILDSVERRVAAGVATPDEIRAAAEDAAALGAVDRAEALLAAVVDRARASGEGLAGTTWAPVALARLRQDRGDHAGAADLLLETAAAVGVDPVWNDAIACALAARDAGALDVAARVLGALREHRPSDRDAWEPLFDVYAALGDHARLEALAGELLPALVDVGERNRLRMKFAAVLAGDDAGRRSAIELYKDVLLDDPANAEAAERLEALLEQTGSHDELIAFLHQRFEDARQSGDPAAVAAAARRLGARLEPVDRAEAVAVYRVAAEVAPDDAALLRALVDALGDDADPAERAGWLERLLAVSEGADAAAIAEALYDARLAAGDEAGAQRALELGVKAAPDSDLRDRLEAWYRERGMARPLADLLADEARRAGGGADAVARWLDAARLYRGAGDTDAAIEALRCAADVAPGDLDVLAELVRTLRDRGEVDAAIAASTRALDALAPDAPERAAVLMLQAEVELSAGSSAAAVADLEEAFAIDPDRAGDALRAALEQARIEARQRDDASLERVATRRLADLQRASGDLDAARATLAEWLERAPDDRDALAAAVALDAERGAWAEVIDGCNRLVQTEQGDAQVRAALQLVDAAERAGDLAAARPGLELAARDNPDAQELRAALRRVYEAAGAFDELAKLALADARDAADESARFAALMEAADLFVRAGDGDRAILALDSARALRPDDEELTLRYIDALVAAGRLDEAREALAPLIANTPVRSKRMAPLQLREARLARAAGDAAGELRALQQVFDIERDNGAVAAELARAAEECGDIALAIKALRTISLKKLEGPMTPRDAVCAEARLELARGNPGKARMLVRKVLREQPDYGPAIEILEAAQK